LSAGRLDDGDLNNTETCCLSAIAIISCVGLLHNLEILNVNPGGINNEEW
jgi:hypothetical protein